MGDVIYVWPQMSSPPHYHILSSLVVQIYKQTAEFSGKQIYNFNSGRNIIIVALLAAIISKWHIFCVDILAYICVFI